MHVWSLFVFGTRPVTLISNQSSAHRRTGRTLNLWHYIWQINDQQTLLLTTIIIQRRPFFSFISWALPHLLGHRIVSESIRKQQCALFFFSYHKELYLGPSRGSILENRCVRVAWKIRRGSSTSFFLMYLCNIISSEKSWFPLGQL